MSAPNDDTAEPAPAEGDAGRIDSRDGFHRALLAALDEAADAGSAELWLCDPDFDAWPLGRPAMVDALGRWVGSRRRLRLIAADYQGLPRRHPRWMAWRQQWSHVVQCLAVHEELVARVPTLLLVPGRVAVRLHDRERHRGRVERAATDLLRAGELIDALSQRADESLPVTTLGL